MLSAVELAAYLGVTPDAVRAAVRRHHIPPAGRRGNQKLYDPKRVLQVMGRHDRLAPKGEAVSQ